MNTPELPGLLMLAHGARDAAWATPFEAVAAQVRAARPQVPLRMCFLEFMAPNLLQGGAELAAAGCTRVQVLPLFLGAGGHVRKDVPGLMARLAEDHPQVRWQLLPAVGEAPALVAALAGIAIDSLDHPS